MISLLASSASASTVVVAEPTAVAASDGGDVVGRGTKPGSVNLEEVRGGDDVTALSTQRPSAGVDDGGDRTPKPDVPIATTTPAPILSPPIAPVAAPTAVPTWPNGSGVSTPSPSQPVNPAAQGQVGGFNVRTSHATHSHRTVVVLLVCSYMHVIVYFLSVACVGRSLLEE